MQQRDIVTVKVWKRNGLLAWTNKNSRTSSGDGCTTAIAGSSAPTASRSTTSSTRRSTRTGRSPKLVGTGADGEDAFERNELGYRAALRGLRADREREQDARDRRLRDLREPAGARPADRLAAHDAVARRRRRVPGALGRARAARARRLAHAAPPEREAPRPHRCGSSRRTGCSRRAPSTRSRASTPRSTRRIRTRPGHSQRVQRIAVALGEELGLEREQLDVAPLRRALPRHRQDRRPRRHPHQAGPADGARVRDREAAPRGRRADRRPAPPAARRRARGPPPPRALGREGLSARPAGRRRSRSRPRSSASRTPSTR